MTGLSRVDELRRIATVEALANTSLTTKEYMQRSADAADKRRKARVRSEFEEAIIEWFRAAAEAQYQQDLIDRRDS